MEKDRVEKRIPRKHGKPDRDALILRLASEGLSDAQIAWDERVVKANGGKKMDRRAVQRVRLRQGKAKT